jgi:hypothetical protein
MLQFVTQRVRTNRLHSTDAMDLSTLIRCRDSSQQAQQSDLNTVLELTQEPSTASKWPV